MRRICALVPFLALSFCLPRPGAAESLEAPGRILAQIVAAESGEPLATACQVVVVKAGEEPPIGLPVYSCQPDGRVEIANLPPGSYHLATTFITGRARTVFGTGTCNSRHGLGVCDLAGATAIEVRTGQDSGPFPLEVEKSVEIGGRVEFFGLPSVPAPIAHVKVFDERGVEAGYESMTALWHDEFHLTGLAPGTYHLVVDGLGAWQSFAWPGVPCNRWYCDPALGEPIELQAGEVAAGFDSGLSVLAPYEGCTPSETSLCLNQGRYRVSATWRDFAGASGAGTARPLTAETGYFYFFSPDNLEVMVKALNACDPLLGRHFWIYGAGLTTVQVELLVEDTLTGATKVYTNNLGQVFQPILDSAAFATCDGLPASGNGEGQAAPPAAGASVPLEAAVADFYEGAGDGPFCEQEDGITADLCLGGRFRVNAAFETPAGLDGLGSTIRITGNTGVFRFFSLDNIELVVKMLDACHTEIPGHWLFASGLTDVKVDLTVEDLATGEVKTYPGAFGPFAPIIDLGAFGCP
jgi:hypothetical protein